MRRTWCVSVLVFLAAVLTAGMGPKPEKAPTRVTEISISDREVLRKTRPLTISFSAPMVAQETVGKELGPDAMPFALDPALPGTGVWTAENSVSFVPTDGYPRGRTFKLLMRENLRDREGNPVRHYYAFRTAATEVLQVLPLGFSPLDNKLRVLVEVSHPLSPQALQSHLEVEDRETGERLSVVPDAGTDARIHHDLTLQMDRYRPEVVVRFLPDGENDPAPAGFGERSSSTVVRVAQPTGSVQSGASLAGGEEARASDQDISYLYFSEQADGRLVARAQLRSSLSFDQKHADFISLVPDLPYTLTDGGSTLLVSEGVNPGAELSVTLKPGLLDASGRVLREERSQSRRAPDRRARVSFTDQGNMLTPAQNSTLGLDLVNVRRVSVSLHRYYDNNLPLMNYHGSPMGAVLGHQVAFREVEVGAAFNEIERRSIDLGALAGNARGVFVLEVTGYAPEQRHADGGARQVDERLYPVSSDERLVVLSDIGMTVRSFRSGLNIFVASLSRAAPLPGALVRVYSASNQLLLEGRTGADGVLNHQRSEPWEKNLWPHTLVVTHGEDISFLPLNWDSSVELEEFGTRDDPRNGLEAFVYTPRGVFRPGETVDLKAFVRTAGLAAPDPCPVLMTVFSSKGLEAARATSMLSDEGGADFSFVLPATAPTGRYRARLSLPGQPDAELGFATFLVEDFTPPRLEVRVAPGASSVIGRDGVSVDLEGQYLFGAPGDGLEFELGYQASSRAFSPEGWEDFVFGDHEREFGRQVNLRYITGTLGSKGAVNLSFPIPEDWTPPAALQVQLIGSVREDGGRWATQTGQFIYYPTPYFIGLRRDAGNGSGPGEPMRVDVAAVSVDGGPADPGPLEVSVFRVHTYWNTVLRDGRSTYVRTTRLLPHSTEHEVYMADGRGMISFTPPVPGRYLVRCETADGSVRGSYTFGVWGRDGTGEDEGSGRMDQVELALDKADYLPGETAKLSIKAPYAGLLYLGLEKDGQLWTTVRPLPEPSTTIEIPVTRAMAPASLVTAWVYRPVSDADSEWYAHRAYGSLPVKLSRAPHTLYVAADAPERAVPAAPLSIPFVVSDDRGAPVQGEFSVALVDEGILSLTAFRTPEPGDFFLAMRRFGTRSYDIYNRLLRPEARTVAPLLPGGDVSAEYHGSVSTNQIFLAGFLSTVRTDASGRGEAVFDVPEYSGRGRLMIVGAAGQRFASAAVPVRFARDLTVELSMPRAVAPKDRFDIPLAAFSPETGLDAEARVTVRVSGPLALEGPEEFTFAPFAPGQKQTRMMRARALEEAGVATVRVEVAVPGRDDLSFVRQMEVAVRPPFPRISLTTALPAGPGRHDLNLPGKWLKKSARAAISVDRSPVFTVLRALEVLREYPYGCLEQTVSRAFPYLSLASVQEALASRDPDMPDADVLLRDTVRRVLSLQSTDGGFSMWPGQGRSELWKSVHATFFLVEARSSVAVPADNMTRALGYLRFVLSASDSVFHSRADALSTKAYAAFVLQRAGEPVQSWLQHLALQEKDMLPSGRIFLAAARALEAGNPRSLEPFRNAPPKLSAEHRGTNPTLENELRNRSLVLMVWSMVAPDNSAVHDLGVGLARDLATARYLTTQDAGMAAYALGLYLGKTGRRDKPFTAELSVDGAVAGRTEDGRLHIAVRPMPLRPDGTPAPVALEVIGEGEAYCVAYISGVPLDTPEPAANGLSLRRVWKDAQGRELVSKDAPLALHKGDRVTVELHLQADRPVEDVVLSDLLPGGMEVENPRLQTAASHTSEQGYGAYMDLREDRLLLFFSELSTRPVVWTYTLRAVSSGEFFIPPASAEGMYAPEMHAATAAGRLIVTEQLRPVPGQDGAASEEQRERVAGSD